MMLTFLDRENSGDLHYFIKKLNDAKKFNYIMSTLLGVNLFIKRVTELSRMAPNDSRQKKETKISFNALKYHHEI